MKLEKQVTSLKLSKKLKSLGCKQESLFSYIFTERMNVDTKNGDWSNYRLEKTIENPTDTCGEQVSAFTVAELGEKLKETQPELDNPFPSYGLITKRWFLLTEDGSIEAKTEANARAKTIIYLKGI